MSIEVAAAAQGGTRWRRFALAFGASFGLMATVLGLMAAGVLALPVTVSGTEFRVTASSLVAHPNPNGSTFVQYGSVDQVSSTDVRGVAVTELPAGGVLTNMNQTVCGPTGLPGPVSHLLVTLKADKADATGGLIVHATQLNGETATFNNIQIGVPGPGGTFAQKADGVTIENIDQTAVYTQAGTFKLSNLGLSAKLVSSCP
ncbi:MAG TPA: DUF6230 family protein [Jatrophihabitans sp.]|nr:DUF6230 family protein [Jatrophihabitans sp.]